MTITTMHREDIKAELRKRHGTLGAFAKARGLKSQAVVDWLRGRPSAAVGRVIATELGVGGVQHDSAESIKVDDSATNVGSHRLNAGAR